MGFKKKLVGFVAAAALTLSMAGGVAAESKSDSVDGSVELAAGACSVSIGQSEVNFGTWTWMGETQGYDHTGGNNKVSITGSVDNHKPGGLCDVDMQTY